MNPSTTHLLSTVRPWFALAAALLLGAGLPGTARAESPGLDAIEDFRDGRETNPAVENRFFLKNGRLELAPLFGYVPNNPFARRYVGGVLLGYHFNETISAQVQVLYSPDLGENDLKQLTSVLLDRAYTANNGGDDNAFQQPLDKVALGATFGVAWAPLYGKINLVGETVLNFDFYVFGGIGMVSKNDYVATYDENAAAGGDIVLLTERGNEVKVGPYVGIGQNYFLNQTIAFKLDLRASFYIDNRPQYNPDIPVNEQRLYNNFVAGGGIGFFFPKMKPRLYDF